MTIASPPSVSMIWQAYEDYRNRLVEPTQAIIFGGFERINMEGIEARALAAPAGPVADLHGELIVLLNRPDLHLDAEAVARVKEAYDEACKKTFPAYCAYLSQVHALQGITSNVSLDSVQSDILRDIDLQAHLDPTLGTFVKDMVAILKSVTSAPDSIAYGQFFEIYAEAIVYRYYQARGVLLQRIVDSTSAPDFFCELEGGKTFYIEVKALDVVDGMHRHNEMMLDGIEPNLDIERQQRAGKRIATGISEIAPYKKAFGDKDYDPRSLKRVIDTLRSKCRQAFKASQFKRGPTFAVVLADRLVIPGWRSAIAPYYYDESFNCLVSGVLWNAAFGTTGAPVLRLPDFEGAANVEGHLEAAGLFVDPAISFPGQGLLVLLTTSSRRVSYGLKSTNVTDVDWTNEDTEEALTLLSDAWNDVENCEGFDLVRFTPEL